MAYIIRAFTEADAEKMRELLSTRPGIEAQEVEDRLRMMRWMAHHNPLAKGEPTYFVAEDNDRIIAYIGRMPMPFVIRGEFHKGYYVHDWYVHPDVRKAGRGLFLAFDLEKKAKQESDAFCCGVWGNDTSRAIVKRLGYFFNWADGYCKLLDVRWQIDKWFKNPVLAGLAYPLLNVPLSIADTIAKWMTPSADIVAIDRFDERFDALCERTLGLVGISAPRTSAYLNWKYVDRPYPPDAMLAARADGRILGYVVLALDPPDGGGFGIILDIMADPRDAKTISALVQKSIDYFRDNRAKLIVAVMTDRRFIKVLKRHLFIKRKWACESIVLSDLQKFTADAEVLKDLANWHLTKSESDGFIIHRLLSKAERRRRSYEDVPAER